MKYYNVYNGNGKMAVMAFNENDALKKYCSFNGMLSVPDKYIAEEISKDDYDKAYYKII